MTDPIEAIIERIADRVVEKLRHSSPTDVYTSRNPPPGITRRKFNERCRRIPEARLDGRVWIISVDAYDAALRRGKAPQATPAPATRPDTLAILAANGIKLKRTG